MVHTGCFEIDERVYLIVPRFSWLQLCGTHVSATGCTRIKRPHRRLAFPSTCRRLRHL